MGRGRDAHKGIRGAHAFANGLSFGICPKAIAQESNIALIDLLKAADSRCGISESFGRDAWRSQDAWCRVHVLDRMPKWAQIPRMIANWVVVVRGVFIAPD